MHSMKLTATLAKHATQALAYRLIVGSIASACFFCLATRGLNLVQTKIEPSMQGILVMLWPPRKL